MTSPTSLGIFLPFMDESRRIFVALLRGYLTLALLVAAAGVLLSRSS
jgi:hypothetical protein